MDILSRYQALKSKSIAGVSHLDSLKSQLQELNSRLISQTNNLKSLKDSIIIQQTSIDILKELTDRLSQQYLDSLESLLTNALQVIFYDHDYKVSLQITNKRNNKSAEFFLIENTPNGQIKSSFKDGVGGGILAVVGTILQIYYINVFNLSPILFIDEGLSQVSVQYIQPFVQFLKTLSEQYNYIFVLISHDSRYISLADRVYQVDNGTVQEVHQVGVC